MKLRNQLLRILAVGVSRTVKLPGSLRIRYTSMSLPYHICNGWFDGFLPTIAFAMVVASGNIYQGLWCPIVIATMSLVIGTLFLPETKDVDIRK